MFSGTGKKAEETHRDIDIICTETLHSQLNMIYYTCCDRKVSFIRRLEASILCHICDYIPQTDWCYSVLSSALFLTKYKYNSQLNGIHFLCIIQVYLEVICCVPSFFFRDKVAKASVAFYSNFNILYLQYI